jgi:hypothetical protein
MAALSATPVIPCLASADRASSVQAEHAIKLA